MFTRNVENRFPSSLFFCFSTQVNLKQTKSRTDITSFPGFFQQPVRFFARHAPATNHPISLLIHRRSRVSGLMRTTWARLGEATEQWREG